MLLCFSRILEYVHYINIIVLEKRLHIHSFIHYIYLFWYKPYNPQPVQYIYTYNPQLTLFLCFIGFAMECMKNQMGNDFGSILLNLIL